MSRRRIVPIPDSLTPSACACNSVRNGQCSSHGLISPVLKCSGAFVIVTEKNSASVSLCTEDDSVAECSSAGQIRHAFRGDKDIKYLFFSFPFALFTTAPPRTLPDVLYLPRLILVYRGSGKLMGNDGVRTGSFLTTPSFWRRSWTRWRLIKPCSFCRLTIRSLVTAIGPSRLGLDII